MDKIFGSICLTGLLLIYWDCVWKKKFSFSNTIPKYEYNVLSSTEPVHHFLRSSIMCKGFNLFLFSVFARPLILHFFRRCFLSNALLYFIRRKWLPKIVAPLQRWRVHKVNPHTHTQTIRDRDLIFVASSIEILFFLPKIALFLKFLNFKY